MCLVFLVFNDFYIVVVSLLCCAFNCTYIYLFYLIICMYVYVFLLLFLIVTSFNYFINLLKFHFYYCHNTCGTLLIFTYCCCCWNHFQLMIENQMPFLFISESVTTRPNAGISYEWIICEMTSPAYIGHKQTVWVGCLLFVGPKAAAVAAAAATPMLIIIGWLRVCVHTRVCVRVFQPAIVEAPTRGLSNIALTRSADVVRQYQKKKKNNHNKKGWCTES